MSSEPLVSIIIPIFNAEEYLRECLDSVCGQEYRNIEIVLVNDGSTDASLSICEEYAQSDNRVLLINKDNGGSPSARNAGLKIIKGEFIGFVDSDDMLHSKFVQTLLTAILESDSSMALCDCCSDLNQFNCENGDYTILSKEQAISGLLDDSGYKCCSGTRLYRRWLFDGLCYPEGKLFEDIALMYDIFKRADKVAYAKQPMYYYRMRKGSITKSKFSSGYYSLLESLDYVLDDSCELSGVDHNRIMTGYLSYYMGLFVRRGLLSGAKIDAEVLNLRRLIKENVNNIIANKYSLKRVKKIEMLLFAYVPFLYRFSLIIIRKK